MRFRGSRATALAAVGMTAGSLTLSACSAGDLRSGGEVRRSALVIAAWARYAEGVDEAGEPVDVVDQRREVVMGRARRQREDPLAFLRDPSLFGDLVEDERFTGPYLEALESLHTRGARATLVSWGGGLVTGSAAPARG